MGFIDLGATQQESGFVGKLLARFGLPNDIGQAIAALARTIRDHKHLEQLLTSAEPTDRQSLYDSVKPHLRFNAKPLDMYVSSAGQRAEREQWPTLGEDGKLHAFRPAADVSSLRKAAENAIAASLANRTLTLTCSSCFKEETFYGVGEETRVATVIKARKAGWIYDYTTDPPREICPKCPTHLRPTPPPPTPNNLPQPCDL